MCVNQSSPIVALVDKTGGEQNKAIEIWQKLKSYMSDEAAQYLTERTYPDESAIMADINNLDAFNTNELICLALVVNKWNPVKQDYTVNVRFANQVFQDLMQNNMTKTQ